MASFAALTIQSGTQKQQQAADTLLVGAGIDAGVSGGLNVGGTNTTSVAVKIGTTILAALAALSSDFVSLGASPSATGTLRLANAFTIKARNAANSADLQLATIDSGNNAVLGNSVTSPLFIDGFTSVTIRPNGSAVYAFNSTVLTIAAGAANWSLTYAAVATAGATAFTMNFQGQNATGTGTTTGGGFQFTTGTGTTVGAFKISAGATAIAYLGADSTNDFLALGAIPSTAGALRFTNGFTLTARNGANSANLTLLSLDGANNFVMGGAGLNLYYDSAASINFRPVSGTVTLTLTGTTFLFAATSLNMRFGYASSATVSGTGQLWTMNGQDMTGTTSIGGDVVLRVGGGTTRAGSLRFQAGSTATPVTMLELSTLASNQRVVAFNLFGTLTTAQMPASTGDGVIYIAEATTAPTANPVGGGILYNDAGSLKFRSKNGTVTIIGPL